METNREVHTTAKKLCDNYNISYSSYMYYRKNFPNASVNSIIERISGKVIRDRNIFVGIEYENKIYNSYKELCAEFDISYTTFQNNRKNYPHKSMEFWLNKQKTHSRSSVVEYRGITHSSISKLCKFLGIHYKSVLYRKINYPNRSLDYWLYGRRLNVIEFNDIIYKSYADLCKSLGLSYSYFRYIKKKHYNDNVNTWVSIVKHRQRLFKGN